MGFVSFFGRKYDSLIGFVGRMKYPLLTIIAIGAILRILLFQFSMTDYFGWYKALTLISTPDIGLYARDGVYYGPAPEYIMAIALFISNFIMQMGVLFTQVDQLGLLTGSFYGFTPFVPTTVMLFTMKVMMIVGDIVLAYCVYWMVEHYTDDRNKAILAFALVFLSPIIIIESSIHGMFDVWVAAMALLSFVLLMQDRYYLAGLTWAAATLTKIFPAYLFPVFVAFILYKNRDEIKEGLKKIGFAAAGALTTFVLIYYPTFMDGTFVDSWGFLLRRATGGGEVIESTGSSTGSGIMFIIGIIALAAGILLCVYFYSRYKKGEKGNNVKIPMIAAPIIGAILMIVGAGSGKQLFNDLDRTGFLVGITIQVLAVFIAFYFAYRYYKSERKDRMRLALILGTLSVAAAFVWVPMPQYLILLLPFVAVYAVMYDTKYITPFILISVGAAFFILMVEGLSALAIPLSVNTGLVGLDDVMNGILWHLQGSQIGKYSLLQIVLCAIGAAVQLFGVLLLFAYRTKYFRNEEGEW